MSTSKDEDDRSGRWRRSSGHQWLRSDDSDLKEGVAKATAGLEATQAKMKEGVEKGYEDGRRVRCLQPGQCRGVS